MERERCPQCGARWLLPARQSREVVADDGVRLTYADELTACLSCGERYYKHQQSLASSRARAAVLRKHAGLLTPDEIRAFRERHRLTQAQLEALLGTGPKTVVRWEKGTVCQSRAADRLLRLLIVNPKNVEFLAARGGPDDPAVAAGSPGDGPR